MRSLWKGTISFGLVTIPVKLYTATEDRDVKFRYLHADCKTPVKYVKTCPACQREVAMAEIVRGYEYEPGRFVVFDDDDFADLPAPQSRTVEILEFIRLAEVDPIYYDKTYFLEPGEGAAKAYGLLHRALSESGRVGIGRVAIRSRSTLAAIRVYTPQVLAMETMHDPDEVRSPAALHIPALPAVREPELQMASALIQMLAAEFRPEALQDDYRTVLLERIQAKVAGAEVHIPAAAAPTGQVVDLMEALRQSIELARSARRAAGGAAAEIPAGPAAADTEDQGPGTWAGDGAWRHVLPPVPLVPPAPPAGPGGV